MKILIFLNICVLYFVQSQTVPPTYLTSSYFIAGYQAVIPRTGSKTGEGTRPSHTFTFSNGGFGSVPELGYGVKGYEGNFLFI